MHYYLSGVSVIIFFLSLHSLQYYIYASSEGSGKTVQMCLLIEKSCSSVVECLTQDRGVVVLSLTGVTVLCPIARHFIGCLVLVQPRKTRPNMTEKLTRV